MPTLNMITAIIDSLSRRISSVKVVERVFGLGLIYRLKDSTEQVVFENGQPRHIDFDQYKSLCFFLLNGAESLVQRDSEVSAGVYLYKKIPLRLIYFANRAGQDFCSAWREQPVQNISSALVFQDDKELRGQFKLSSVSLQATARELRPDVVWSQIFGKLPYKLQEEQQLVSLDFELCLEGDPACWISDSCTDDKALDDENFEPLQDGEGEVIEYG